MSRIQVVPSSFIYNAGNNELTVFIDDAESFVKENFTAEDILSYLEYSDIINWVNEQERDKKDDEQDRRGH